MGAPVGRRQPRAAKDVAVRAWHIVRSRLRSLVFRGSRESDLSEELQLHLERETERLQASGLSREDARLQARAPVRRRRADQGSLPRRARDGGLRRAGARHAPRPPPPGARLALHHGGGADPRPRHRRQHRDLQRRERGAVPRPGVRRPRSPRRHLSERSRRQAAHRHLVRRLQGDGGVHRHLCGDDGRHHPDPRPLSPRRRHSQWNRRVRDGDLSRRPGTPAVARPLVRRDGGAARGSARRRPRASGVDPRVPRGPLRRRTRRPDRRRAGDDRRHRSRQSPRHPRRRSRHGLLAADYRTASS